MKVRLLLFDDLLLIIFLRVADNCSLGTLRAEHLFNYSLTPLPACCVSVFTH